MAADNRHKESFLIQRANFEKFRKLYKKKISDLDESPFEVTHEIDVKFTTGGLKHRHQMRVPESTNLRFMTHKTSCDLFNDGNSNGWRYEFHPSVQELVDDYSYILYENSPLLRYALDNFGGFWRVYVDAIQSASGKSYADLEETEVNGLKWQSVAYNLEYLVPGFSSWLISDYFASNFDVKRIRVSDIEDLDGNHLGRHIEEREADDFLVLNELERLIAQELMAFVETCNHPEPMKCELCGEFEMPDIPLNIGFNFPDTFCSFCSTIVGYSHPQPSFLNEGRSVEDRKQSLVEGFKSFLKIVNIPYWKSPLIGRIEIFPLNLRNKTPSARKKLAHILSSVPKHSNFQDLFESPRHFLHEADLESLIPPDKSRGIKSISRCGHLCLSNGEREICEYFYEKQIAHSREPLYKDLVGSTKGFGEMRGDFLVGVKVVEYAGLQGNEEYDTKMQLKSELATKHGIDLLIIYPHELDNLSLKLETFDHHQR